MKRSFIKHKNELTSWVALDQQMLQKFDEGLSVLSVSRLPNKPVIFPAINDALLEAGGWDAFLLSELHPTISNRRMQSQDGFVRFAFQLSFK